MCLTHIVLPCNPDETGRPLPPDERLQCLADGEHSIAHHIYPLKVILTYLSHNFASSLAIPLLCTLLHFHNPESFPIDAAFSFGSSDLTRFQRASCVLIPSGLSLPPYLINSLWEVFVLQKVGSCRKYWYWSTSTLTLGCIPAASTSTLTIPRLGMKKDHSSYREFLRIRFAYVHNIIRPSIVFRSSFNCFLLPNVHHIKLNSYLLSKIARKPICSFYIPLIEDFLWGAHKRGNRDGRFLETFSSGGQVREWIWQVLKISYI